MIKVWNIRQSFTRRIVLLSVGAMLLCSGVIAFSLSQKHATPTASRVSKAASGAFVAKTATKAVATQQVAAATANAVATPPPVAPTSTSKAVTPNKTATPQATKPATTTPSAAPTPTPSGYPYALCNQKLAVLYTSYNNDIRAENVTHQHILADLKQKYDTGGFEDPDTGDLAAAYNDYQSAIEQERVRLYAATQAIEDNYNGQLHAVGCTQSRV